MDPSKTTHPPKKGFRITAFVVGLVFGILVLFAAAEVQEKTEAAAAWGSFAAAFGEDSMDAELADIQALHSAADLGYLGAIAAIVGASLCFRSIKGGWVTLASGSGVLLLCGLMGWEDAFFYAAALITATVFGFLARRAAVEQQAATPIDETPQ